MTTESKISGHYTHGELLNAIEQGLGQLGKTRLTVSETDLAPVDEFHIGGREASIHFLNQLEFCKKMRVLDIGCGLGGPARFTSGNYGAQVTGIDLTSEYIETGQALNSWLGLGDQVELLCENALEMKFEQKSFDGAYMMHVGMNIENKPALFTEVFRVLKPGSRFGIYDIMRKADGDLKYPVPWATDASTSWLAEPDQYVDALRGAGFSIIVQTDRGQFALDFFKKLQAQRMDDDSKPALSLHTLMGASTPLKLSNMVANIKAGLIAPCEIIASKSER